MSCFRATYLIYADQLRYASNFTTNAYHGTVVWSWQLAMMAAGLERQLDRCTVEKPNLEFCDDKALYTKVRLAYNKLWDTIEQNSAQLASEVWSWTYSAERGYQVKALGSLPPPPGQSPVESDVRQLWSLAWLAVKRNTAFAN